MAMIKGITVILVDKISDGVDPFGTPIYRDAEIPVDNVLVTPSTTDDMVNQLNLTGKKSRLYLGYSKGR